MATRVEFAVRGRDGQYREVSMMVDWQWTQHAVTKRLYHIIKHCGFAQPIGLDQYGAYTAIAIELLQRAYLLHCRSRHGSRRTRRIHLQAGGKRDTSFESDTQKALRASKPTKAARTNDHVTVLPTLISSNWCDSVSIDKFFVCQRDPPIDRQNADVKAKQQHTHLDMKHTLAHKHSTHAILSTTSRHVDHASRRQEIWQSGLGMSLLRLWLKWVDYRCLSLVNRTCYTHMRRSNGGVVVACGCPITSQSVGHCIGTAHFGPLDLETPLVSFRDTLQSQIENTPTYSIGVMSHIAGSRYDHFGYDRDGYNSHGYNRQGYNRLGYDRFGYNRHGRVHTPVVFKPTYIETFHHCTPPVMAYAALDCARWLETAVRKRHSSSSPVSHIPTFPTFRPDRQGQRRFQLYMPTLREYIQKRILRPNALHRFLRSGGVYFRDQIPRPLSTPLLHTRHSCRYRPLRSRANNTKRPFLKIRLQYIGWTISWTSYIYFSNCRGPATFHVVQFRRYGPAMAHRRSRRFSSTGNRIDQRRPFSVIT